MHFHFDSSVATIHYLPITGKSVITMGDIVRFRKPPAKLKHKGNTLCRNGFHKWQIVTERRFDVKQGQLVTEYRCQRCGASRLETH